MHTKKTCFKHPKKHQNILKFMITDLIKGEVEQKFILVNNHAVLVFMLV